MKILLVEDEALIAMDIADTLSEAGHEVVGPAATVSQARRLIAENVDLQFALLDVNLRGEPAYPVADMLNERGVAFVFTSGYGRTGLDAKYALHAILPKPISKSALLRALDAAALEAP